MKDLIDEYVLVRSRNSGVHAGILESADALNIVLKDSVRVWSWSGAFSCSEIALDGIKTGNLGKKLPKLVLFTADCCEIIPLTRKARRTLGLGDCSCSYSCSCSDDE